MVIWRFHGQIPDFQGGGHIAAGKNGVGVGNGGTGKNYGSGVEEVATPSPRSTSGFSD